MQFKGQANNLARLPRLPSFEPQVDESRNYATQSGPLLNIVIQVVGSRGKRNLTV